MKRTFTLLGAVLLCLAGIIQPVKAETIASGTCGDNLTWTLTDSGTLTISGTGEMYDPYSRPIGWMSYIGDIKKVLIEQGVTSIGSVAFRYCSNLISITIPEGVMSIGNEAFSGCTSLTSITIPEGVASIEDYAFSKCTSLTSITLPEGVTRIGNRAFDLCRSLTSITLPEDVTSIGDKAFDNCSGLIQITVQATTPPTVGDNPFFFGQS